MSFGAFWGSGSFGPAPGGGGSTWGGGAGTGSLGPAPSGGWTYGSGSVGPAPAGGWNYGTGSLGPAPSGGWTYGTGGLAPASIPGGGGGGGYVSPGAYQVPAVREFNSQDLQFFDDPRAGEDPFALFAGPGGLAQPQQGASLLPLVAIGVLLFLFRGK